MGSILRSLWTGVRVGVAAYEMTRKGLVGDEVLRSDFIGGLTLVNKIATVTLRAVSPVSSDGIPVEKTDEKCDGVVWNIQQPKQSVAEELRAYGLGISVDEYRSWDATIQNRINAARVNMGERYKR